MVVSKEEIENRLSRVSGQIQGVKKMVEEDRYCIDVLIQIAAVRAALDRAGLLVLKRHLETCVTKAIKEEKGEELIEELDEALTKFLK
ncbi:MAG: metal-sensitive transcriptional regulator [Actinobacteria bacterium]|nr:metal-sensitive transcriptional regulator [Actinomycetota bacterium]